MKRFTYNRWLIGMIFIGLLAALTIDFQRHTVEEQNRTIELAIDYEGLVELAQLEGLPASEVLAKARAAGITSLAVYDTTLEKLSESGKVGVVSGSEVLRNFASGALSDQHWRALVETGRIVPEEIYIIQYDLEVFAELRQDLRRRLGVERVAELPIGRSAALAVKANYEKGLKWDLGMPEQEMNAVNEAGFSVLARPTNYHRATDGDVQSVFERLNKYRVSGVVFSGKEALGYPDALATTAECLLESGLTLGMIEHPLQLQFFKQEGLMEIARAVKYRAARLYSIPKDEQLKMNIAAAVDRWDMTNQERNIRLNLLRTFEKPEPSMSLLETNLTYFTKLKERLEAKGFVIGSAGVYEAYYPSRWLLILITMGTVAAGVLYLSLVIPAFSMRWQYLLFVALSCVLAAPLAMGSGAAVRTAVALAAANLLPSLAMIWAMDKLREFRFSPDAALPKIVGAALGLLLTTGILSFSGGAYVGAALGDIEYLLEVNIFRGVKLTFIAPLILVSIAYLQRFSLFDETDGGSVELMTQMRRALNEPLYLKSAAALAVAALAAVIFIGRSGHTAGIPVLGLELKLRAFLEQLLYARPRSKEMLIGHPAYIMAVLAFVRRWPNIVFFTLIVLGTIGQGSLVETFAHLRTPIFMSFMRGVGGLALGGVIGVGCAVICDWLYRYSERRNSVRNE